MSENSIEWVRVNFGENLISEILHALHARKIHSLIVEGGAKTLGSFIARGAWDEARVFKSETRFGEGIRAPKLSLNPVLEEGVESDTLSLYLREIPLKGDIVIIKAHLLATTLGRSTNTLTT